MVEMALHGPREAQGGEGEEISSENSSLEVEFRRIKIELAEIEADKEIARVTASTISQYSGRSRRRIT